MWRVYKVEECRICAWFLDPEHRVGLLKLDPQPLYKAAGWSAYVNLYDAIVLNATRAGIEVQFMESNAVPGDPCKDNCPDTCSAKPGSSSDSCTPSYMDAFHATVRKLFQRYKDVRLGVSYDVEQTTKGDFSPVWDVLRGKIKNFAAEQAAARGSLWAGYSLIRPMIFSYNDSTALMSTARSLDDQHYFSALNTGWTDPAGPILGKMASKTR